MATSDADLQNLSYAPDIADRISRKRQEEIARRARFFDAKSRMIGVDKPALDQQCADKRAQKEAEAAEEMAAAAHAAMCDEAASAIEQVAAAEAHQKEVDTKAYSLKYLRKDMRREYHLSDPLAQKRELPARVGDDDPRCGPSSMQQFSGELIEKDKTENKKAYQDLQKSWLLEQMAYKQAVAKAEKEMDDAYDQQVLASTEVRCVIEQHARDAAREAKAHESNCNLQLAAQARANKQAFKTKEFNQKMEHATNLRESSRMKEEYDAPIGATGRLVREDYKRLSRDARQAVYDANAEQILEKRAREQAEREEEALEVQNRMMSTEILSAVEDEQRNSAMQRRRQMDAENALLSQAHKSQLKEQTQLYSNEVTESFFNGFNTSAR